MARTESEIARSRCPPRHDGRHHRPGAETDDLPPWMPTAHAEANSHPPGGETPETDSSADLYVPLSRALALPRGHGEAKDEKRALMRRLDPKTGIFDRVFQRQKASSTIRIEVEIGPSGRNQGPRSEGFSGPGGAGAGGREGLEIVIQVTGIQGSIPCPPPSLNRIITVDG